MNEPSGRPPRATVTRRHLLRGGTLLLGGIGLSTRWAPALPVAPGGPISERWGWHLDVDGNGRLDAADRELVAAALGRQRGRGLDPLPHWDPRADVLGKGVIDRAQLAALELPDGPLQLPPRPHVICFHYGWYRGTQRRAGNPTVRYRGGHYASSSRTTEERFNRLKNEFGIDADLLSWIDRDDIRRAYERGYLSAANLGTRRTGLLYETVINLGGDGARLSFGPGSDTAARLAASFERMGSWAARAIRERGARPLEADGRPVVYVFASHLFGVTNDELPAVGMALAGARAAFAEAYGAPPFLVGDESPFPHDAAIGIDRAWRARWMDAVTRYHHYDEREARALAPTGRWRLDAQHRERLLANERRAVEGFRGTRNEITGHPLLVIPSAAAGFAKHGMPVLAASEDDYLEWLRATQSLTDAHLAVDHPEFARPASGRRPLVFVGSWNEEFEGHALLPASRNDAMIGSDRGGFEWLWALRRLYGYNHLAGAPV